ncbi:MAG TPA: chloride channel protein [Anaerolineae bacterium]|nr:chloride channel protein [Anaerolineae bacterium]
MRAILKSLTDTIAHLSVIRGLPNYFNPEERRQVFQAVVVGAVVWAVVFSLKESVHFIFHEVIHWLENGEFWWVLLPLVVGAILTTLAINLRPPHIIHYRDDEGHIHELVDAEGDGLERAISLYHASEPSLEQTLTGQVGLESRWELPTFSLAIRKFLATLATIGSGGSGGLEASVTLIGESVSAGLFKPRPLAERTGERLGWFEQMWDWWRSANPDDLQTAQLSGIAAAVATLLGTPLAAAFFATEVMYRKRPVIEKLLYSLIAALTAFLMTHLFSDHTAIFEMEERIVPPIEIGYYLSLILIAVLISLVSLYFARLRSSFEYGFHKRQPNIWVRHVTGALFTGAVAIGVFWGLPYLAEWGMIPEEMVELRYTLVLGAGEEPIDAALNGRLIGFIAVIGLATKMLATLATIGSGGSAGLLVPSIYFGTMVAAGCAAFLPYSPQILVAPAITASLVSIVNVPLAALLLTVELFGAAYMLPSIIVLITTFVLAHHTSIYRTQRDHQGGKQIVPGYSVQRILIPLAWHEQTLLALDIRRHHQVTVIGLLERYGGEDRERIVRQQMRMDMTAETRLKAGDMLVVVGGDRDVKALEKFVINVDRPKTEVDSEIEAENG